MKVKQVSLYIKAGKAEAGPPLGTVLGNLGVNSSKFCKEFNAFTENLPSYFKLKVNIVTIIHRKLIQLVQSNNQCSQLFRQYRCRKHRVLSLSSRFKERPIISKERSMLHVWQRVFCPVVDTRNARQGSCI